MSEATKECTLKCKYDSVNDRCHTCGRTMEEVERTLDRDHFMSAEEAKAWGIVDHVYETREAAEAAAAT